MNFQLFICLMCAFVVLPAAVWADDIGPASPDDIQAFDAAVSQKLGNPAQNPKNTASNPMPSSTPQSSPTPTPAATAMPTVGSEEAPKKGNARENLIQQLIGAIQSQDLERFQSVLTPASRATLGRLETMNHLNTMIADYKDFRLVNESVDHAISSAGKNGGRATPILQLFKGSIQATDSSGRTEILLNVEILCGTGICLIQKLSEN